MRRTLTALLLLLACAARVDAALTVTEKLAAGSTSNIASYTSNIASGFAADTTFSIAVGNVGVCFVINTDTDAAETLTGLTQTGQTWTERATFTHATTERTTVYTTPGAGAAAAAITAATTGADSQLGLFFFCYEVGGGPDTTTPYLQSKTADLTSTVSHTVTLDSARATGSVLFHIVTVGADRTWTAEYANTSADVLIATPTREAKIQWVIGGSDTNPLFTLNTASTGGDMAVEIAAAASATPGCKNGVLMMGAGCTP